MKKLLKVFLVVLMLLSCLVYANSKVMAEDEDETGEVRRRKTEETVEETEEPIASVEETAETKDAAIKVTLSKTKVTLYAGQYIELQATVANDDTNAGVTWKLTGAKSKKTKIYYYSDPGEYYCEVDVYGKETATKLTLRATSNADTSKYAEAVITVKPATLMNSVNFDVDLSKLTINESVTGEQVTTAFRELLSNVDLGKAQYLDIDYCFLAKLVWTSEGGRFERLSTSDELLSPENAYFLVFDVGCNKGYAWEDKNIPKVTINGESADITYWWDSNYNANGGAEANSSGWIDAYLQVVLPSQAVKPKLINIYNSANGADIRFDFVYPVYAYYVMQKYNGTWKPIKRVSINDITQAGDYLKVFDTSIKSKYGKGYIYSIAIKDTEGNYVYNTKGLPLYRLKQPTITSIKSSATGSVTLTWSKEECHGYEVQYSSDNGGTWTKAKAITSGSTTTQTIKGLSSGVQYVFRIRCQKTNADRGTTWSQYSKWSSITVK